MRFLHWLLESRKKKCKSFYVTCKYFDECKGEFGTSYDRKARKLDRIDEKIKRTTKKLDRHIEEYKRIANTMR